MEGSIIVNNRQYSFTEFSNLSLENLPVFAHPSHSFIKLWLTGKEDFEIHTSGSTGTPKIIQVSRAQMIASATNTIEGLVLEPGLDALLAMSTERIGGIMMLVRALIGKWNLVLEQPSRDLSEILKKRSFDFTALVPLQVQSLIDKGHKTALESVECIIIGGADLNEGLTTELNTYKNRVYHTYGMTETISHIALRKISQNESTPWFTVIGDNQVDCNEEGCLKVKGKVTNNTWIETNDLIDLDNNRFRWLGRVDLVINTGGVKLQIEEIEKDLQKLVPNHLHGNLCIWKRLDNELGEKVVCICDDADLIQYFSDHQEELKAGFPKYAWPKKWHHIPSLILTASGKIDRVNSLAQSIPVST